MDIGASMDALGDGKILPFVDGPFVSGVPRKIAPHRPLVHNNHLGFQLNNFLDDILFVYFITSYLFHLFCFSV